MDPNVQDPQNLLNQHVEYNKTAEELIGWSQPTGKGGYPSESSSSVAAFGMPPGVAMNPGSQSHATGDCRPCNKFNTPKGCRWGASCAFCHLHTDDPDVKHRGQLGRFGQAEKRWREKKEEVYAKDPKLADLLEKIYGKLHRQCTLIKGKLHDDVVRPLGEHWISENPSLEIRHHMMHFDDVVIPDVLEQFEKALALATSFGDNDEMFSIQRVHDEDVVASDAVVTPTPSIVTSTTGSSVAPSVVTSCINCSSAKDWLNEGARQKEIESSSTFKDSNEIEQVRICERKEREWRRQRENIEKLDKAGLAGILDKIYKDLDKKSIRCKGKLQILLKQERQREKEKGMDDVEKRIDLVLEEVEKIKRFVFQLAPSPLLATVDPRKTLQDPAEILISDSGDCDVEFDEDLLEKEYLKKMAEALGGEEDGDSDGRDEFAWQ